jgi:dTDP-4-dehydrorhamnose reductase
MSKILITGAKGMLGQMLAEVFKEHELTLTDRDEMDITNKSKVHKVIKKIQPEIIIHAAAYIDVERAEDEEVLCDKINIDGSKNIAEAAEAAHSKVIYISTDYAYDGKKSSPCLEDDQINPLGVYAKSKIEGERMIAKFCPESYILRVAWLFGESKSGKNFVETMINLGKTQKTIKVVNDQIGSPTYIRDLAEVIKKIIALSCTLSPAPCDLSPESCALRPAPYLPYGVYNFSGTGETTRYGFTREIFKQLNIKANLKPITTEEFSSKASRPRYSYLSKSKIEKALGIKTRPWQEMLKDYLKRTHRLNDQ